MPNNTNTPVSRNNLFYSKEDFDMEMGILTDYMEEDTNQTVVVYQVDVVKTQQDNIYKDAKKNIQFKLPVEIPCLYEVADNQLKSYDNKTQNGAYVLPGNLKVYVTTTTLKKYDVDIKRGDYIGVMIEENRMYYWVVTNDGKVNTANQLVVGAYKTGFRVIEATPTANEFPICS